MRKIALNAVQVELTEPSNLTVIVTLPPIKNVVEGIEILTQETDDPYLEKMKNQVKSIPIEKTMIGGEEREEILPNEIKPGSVKVIKREHRL